MKINFVNVIIMPCVGDEIIFEALVRFVRALKSSTYVWRAFYRKWRGKIVRSNVIVGLLCISQTC